jgi:ABC-2 type transport system permease protein
MNPFIIEKELRESLYENKGLWMIVVFSCLLSTFAILIVFMKEGSVLAQSDILQIAIKIVLFVTLLVSMVLGASSFVTEREGHTMESLLLTPISKPQLTMAKYMGVLAVGFILLLVSVPYLIVIGEGSGLVPSALFITFFNGTLLLLAFSALSVVFSILYTTSRASILASILVLAVFASPAFMQGLLKVSPLGAWILRIDPFANWFAMMSTMLVDRKSILVMGSNTVPLVVLVIISMAILGWVSNKVTLEGEK